MLSAKLTQRLGDDFSKFILDKHEDGNPDNTAILSGMDKWNNEVGRKEYHKWKEESAAGRTDDSLEKWLYDAVKRGDTINDPYNDRRKWKEDPNGLPFDPGCFKDEQAFKDWQALNRDGKYHIYDPIVLDLDGDGIETVGHDKHVGALFDHNNDGIRTATGWVSADDGILVVDKNKDGIISNGSEIFGDSYRKANGETAVNGYDALAEFDSNQDGKITAEDERFTELKIWRDLNQDGFGSANELFSLTDLGVAVLNLDYKNTNTQLKGNNTLAQTGSYETTDGKTRLMGDVNFSFNALYSRYAERIELTEQQQQTANLQGMGRVRDLREAAALSTSLAHVLAAYSAAETKAEQIALLDNLINAWAKTDPQFNANRTYLMMPFSAKTSNQGTGLTRDQAGALKDFQININDHQALVLLSEKVSILNAFTGETGGTFYVGSKADVEYLKSTITKTYDKLSQQVYQNLLFQTRLQPYLYEIGFAIENDQFQLDYSGITKKFNQIFTENPEKAFVDLAEFLFYQPNIGKQWHAATPLLAKMIEYAEQHQLTEHWLNQIGKEMQTKLGIIFGTEQNDTLNGNENNNVIIGGEGDDKLYGGNALDTLIGGAGNDTLTSYGGNDVLDGGAGDDKLYGGSGADTLIGGAGNDDLSGSYHGDTYLFAKGHGQDTVSDHSGGYAGDDVVKFTDVNYGETRWHKDNYDLIIANQQSDDSVRIQQFFNSSYYEIETFVFQDQTFHLADLKNMGFTLHGTGDDDNINLSSWQSKVNIYGGLGNDTIQAANKDDLLDGGEGDDKLYGGSGSDTLIGGAGNDYLSGGYQGDTYLFSKGHGQDTVSDHSGGYAGDDTVQFTDVSYGETRWHKDNYDLIIANQQSGDSVRIQQFFNSSYYEIETFVFQDQTFRLADLKNMGFTLHGTGGDDNINLSSWQYKVNIYGGLGNDTIQAANKDDLLDGGGGDDKLYGGSGADTLIGGVGNDYLSGGSQSDTYLFAKGHGQDTIYDHSGGYSSDDIVQFTDVSYGETRWHKDNYDLIIANQQSGDSVRIQQFFN
ncbi:calcium-binding protein, partial [Stenoxybacter acetivorans]|uniref:calcium-binding protein n=1 Tax=Stenoxybacter acetivorans TaxID=422441 RepID=UPI003CCB9653